MWAYPGIAFLPLSEGSGDCLSCIFRRLPFFYYLGDLGTAFLPLFLGTALAYPRIAFLPLFGGSGNCLSSIIWGLSFLNFPTTAFLPLIGDCLSKDCLSCIIYGLPFFHLLHIEMRFYCNFLSV